MATQVDSTKRILIAGCGKIGSELGLKLIEKGYEVYGIRRQIDKIPAPIKGIALDLTQTIDAAQLPHNIDGVIYILSASEYTPQAYQSAYVDARKHLNDALGDQLAQLKAYLFVSSTSVYAQKEGEWVDEDSITEPTNFNGEIMRQAEQECLQDFPATIVRFSGIYGSGRNRLLDSVKNKKIYPAEPLIYSNRIHQQDCIGVLSFLLEKALNNEPLQSIYLASDCMPVSMHDIQTWLAAKMNLDVVTDPQLSQQRNAGSKRCLNKRLVDSGYDFIYPDFKVGYSTIINSIMLK